MHYIHRLTPGQKNAAIALFAGIPIMTVLFLAVMWGVNRGMFTKMATLKTKISSAQGIDTQTPITYSGMKIGRVSGIQLGKKEEVELTLTIERGYLGRFHRDAVAIIASANVIGIKEIRITGGSESAPLLNDGDTIVSQGLFDMDNMMERVTPILNAAEKIVFRIEKILNDFPDDRLNSAITDASAVMGNIRGGKSTAGRLLSTDNGEFYNHLEHLMERINVLSERINDATKRLPETMDNAADISGDLKAISHDVKGVTADLPELKNNLDQVMKKMDRVLADVDEMAPGTKKTVANIGTMTEDLTHTTARIAPLLDEIETTLNETLAVVKGVKRSWPVKNMVPPERVKIPMEPAARDTVYGGEK